MNEYSDVNGANYYSSESRLNGYVTVINITTGGPIYMRILYLYCLHYTLMLVELITIITNMEL